MKLRFGTILVAAAFMVGATLSMAQGGGGQGRQGRTGGQGGMIRGGGFGMQGGLVGSGMLIGRQDVQTDLKLTAAQKTKLQTVQEKQREQWRSMGGPGGGPGAGGGDREARMAQMQKMMEQQEKEIDAILTPEQQKRLKQIKVQFSGIRALNDKTVQKDLGLTAAQVTKIEGLQQKQGEANMALFQKMRDGSIDREAMQASLQKNEKALETEVNKVLTADQAAKFKAMKGPEFKRVDPPGGFGGPGGGMGGFGGGNRRQGGAGAGAGGGRRTN